MKRIALTTLFISLTFLSKSMAEKLDLATHNSLIQKIESATQMEKKDSMVLHSKLAHRLADLYAERARLLAMDQEGQGEQIHAAQIRSDRQKSIATLKKVYPTLDKEDRGRALLQMAHLHELLNEKDEALKIYRFVERNPSQFNNQVRSLVEIHLGDLAFFKGQFNIAEKHFNQALAFKENPRKGYTRYRLAWVYFNRGQTKVAEQKLFAVLRDHNNFVTASGKYDAAFKEEVSYDLATFMARNDVTDQSIQELSTLSPENTRKKNLIYLATELDRTSKKKSALKVWAIVGNHEITFEDQLERQIQVTRIEYDLGRKNQLIKEIENSINLLKSSACKGNQECVVATQNLRRIITDWAKAEQRVPSAPLIIAFKTYTNNFEDYEMNYWAAQAANKRKQYKDAFEFYFKAAALLKNMDRKEPAQQKMFEGSLLGAIEVAELSKDRQIRLMSYQRYLEYNPQGNKRDEVRYQIAHWYYEANDYSKASQEFRTLALDQSMNMALREKAGDLCLDSDVLLKNEQLIESHSLELAQALPKKKNEYLAIWRKSILNQTANILNAKPAPADSIYENELKKIQNLTLTQFPPDQRKLLIKNKMELAFRLKNIEILPQFSSELLATPKISREEKNMALQHLAWIAEIRMDFKTALNHMRKVQPEKKQLATYYLKIAMLKELAGQNPTREFEKFLAESKDQRKRQYAAHQIILHSKNPKKAFNKYESLVSGNTELYRSAGLFVYEHTKDDRFARKLMKRSSFRNSPQGYLVANHLDFKDFKVLKAQMLKSKLRPQSDAALRKNLARRTQMLQELEAMANRAIRQKNTSKQLVYLTFAASENKRLANEILALPLPRGLKKEEREQYKAQVQAMVQPYLAQSEAITKKTEELWKVSLSGEVFKDLAQWSLQKDKPGCQLAALEIQLLTSSSRDLGLSRDPFEKLSEQRQKVAYEAQSLQKKISKNPFSYSDLEKMKSLQSTLGSGPMVAYIDGRMSELRSNGGRN